MRLRLTPAGRHALRDWLLGDDDAGRTVRNEFVLGLFLLSALDVADATAVLDDVEQYVLARIGEVEEAQRRLAALGLPSTDGPAMAAEYGTGVRRHAGLGALGARGADAAPLGPPAATEVAATTPRSRPLPRDPTGRRPGRRSQ